MENSKELMVESVNKIIAQKLLALEAVSLPLVGTVVVIQKSAEISRSGKEITPPMRRLDFSSDLTAGISITTLIAESAECSEAQAEELYQSYLQEVKSDDGVVIDGVGTLKGKSFKMTDTFAEKLNPQSVAKSVLPKKERVVGGNKKGKKGGNLLVFALLSAIVAGVIVYSVFNYLTKEEVVVEPVAQEVEQEPTPEAIPEPTPEPVVKPIIYGVVYGIYSTPENVARAIKEVESKFGGNYEAKTHPYSTKTVVTLFESESKREAQRFLNNNYDIMDESWVYEIK